MNTDIREITSTETYAVRHPVLRDGKPLESCRFKGDDLETSVHFGMFTEGELVGVASLFQNSHAFFVEENQLQLRGMAVLGQHQKMGFGETLIRHAEMHATQHHINLIWFNARIVAVPFYERCGYKITGGVFEIGDIGKHFVMFKLFA